MVTTLLWALALAALASWIFGLVSPQTVFGFAQIVLAVGTLLFLMHLVRRRRQKRDLAQGPRSAKH